MDLYVTMAAWLEDYRRWAVEIETCAPCVGTSVVTGGLAVLSTQFHAFAVQVEVWGKTVDACYCTNHCLPPCLPHPHTGDGHTQPPKPPT